MSRPDRQDPPRPVRCSGFGNGLAVLQILTLLVSASTLAAAAFRWSAWTAMVDHGGNEDPVGAADAWVRNMMVLEALTTGVAALVWFRWMTLLNRTCIAQKRTPRLALRHRLASLAPLGHLLLPFAPLKVLHRSLESSRGSIERWQWCSGLWFFASIAGHLSSPPTAKSFGSGSDRLWVSAICFAVALVAAIVGTVDAVRSIRTMSAELDRSWIGPAPVPVDGVPLAAPAGAVGQRTLTALPQPDWRPDRLIALARTAGACMLAGLLLHIGLVVRVWQRNRAWLYGTYNHDGSYSDSDYWRDEQWMGRVLGFLIPIVMLYLITLIPLAVWTFRATRNASRRATAKTRPALACAAWFVPIANLFIPFAQLRTAARSQEVPTRRITFWQISFILASASLTYLVRRISSEQTSHDRAASLWTTLVWAFVACGLAGIHAFAGYLAQRRLSLAQGSPPPRVATPTTPSISAHAT